MKSRILLLPVLLGVLLLLDVFTLRVIPIAFPALTEGQRKWIVYIFIAVKVSLVGLLVWLSRYPVAAPARRFLLVAVFSAYLSQVFILLSSLADEARRAIVFLLRIRVPSFSGSDLSDTHALSEAIPRSAFIAQSGLVLGSLALVTMVSGAGKGVYDYQVRSVDLTLENLPAGFEGLTIAQISDIHSGSFYRPEAVAQGIELLLGLKPDLIFFTGDLVNDKAEEMKEYQPLFSRLKAPLGVFSILGNHDYGDYSWWPTEAAKKQNLDDLKRIHRQMGYELLMNEHRKIKVGNDHISIIGVENWSALSNFPKHGRLDLAIQGTEDSPVKLLLSHDPSHWRAEVLPKYPSIDMMFAGHTHGMQMGIRLPHLQWSPIQYLYPEWAGRYHAGAQQLYVNVGYGFLGYPGRIGMRPEITLFRLSSKNAPKT